MRNPRDVLKKPIVSERSMGLMEQNKYSFYVEPKANKIEIKNAVEELFKVTVTDVNTMNVKGKAKRVGKHIGRTSNRKKAIVTLKQGDKIEIMEGM
ncbi:50S ribosomal protein L23 [Phosphitispora fastidiosa]|uniref:50S ribosomal protein L23 n=1 Tax=Phosphitispora fastidiosa TaxID=2837202 RepID=UPI001E36DC02|nr:50S ribosomal protein L23 [Phosphitispora fastidiosa]MBU7007461.1 large subunit ribosomal protein L23 [Phosphitispora fastidiosa]